MTHPALTQPYVGRFAPTPSGPLHFGSLVAALASYLDAHAHGGQWLLRIEDIDPPRCQPGASDDILRTLEAFGLHWHGQVLYQSQQLAYYQQALAQLQQQGQLFYCTCSRSQLKGHNTYPGHCRAQQSHPHEPHSTRIRVPDLELEFTDLFMPAYKENLGQQVGDFILQRKDGPYAYQLAVVVDDALQGINHVIRGADLYDQTPRQIYLQQRLGYATPTYGHIPLIMSPQGQKLSKQNLAKAITAKQAPVLISDALLRLGQGLPNELHGASIEAQLSWAVEHWQRQSVPDHGEDPIAFMD